jgi:hypothetical protein
MSSAATATTRIHEWQFTEPHSGQAAARELIHRPEARVVVLALGRRWGKTTMVEAAVEDAARGAKVLWSGHRYSSVQLAWNYAIRCLASSAITRKRETDFLIETNAGGMLKMFSLDDPDSGLGWGGRYHYLDEAARISIEARDQTVAATVADHNGTIIALTTPRGKRGRGGWVFRDYQKAVQAEAGYFFRKGPSTENPNPAIAAWCAWAEKNLPRKIYEQEILAEFLDDGGAILDLRSVCVNGGTADDPVRLPFREPHGGERCVLGVDLAKTQDFTVVAAVGERSGRLRFMDRFNRLDWPVQVERVKRIHEEYPGPIYVDATGLGDPVVSMFYAAHVPITPVKFTNESKTAIIQGLQVAVERREFTMPWITEAVAEADTLEVETLSSGKLRYEGAEGFHDDVVIALGLVFYGRNTAGTAWNRLLQEEIDRGGVAHA